MRDLIEYQKKHWRRNNCTYCDNIVVFPSEYYLEIEKAGKRPLPCCYKHVEEAQNDKTPKEYVLLGFHDETRGN